MATKKVAFKVEVDTSDVSKNVDETKDSIEDLGKATEKTSTEMKGGFKAAEQSTKGLGQSIGGLIKALGVVGVALAAFSFMKDILAKNQKIMDALSTASLAFEIVLNKLFTAVEPIGEAMKSAFEDPKKAVGDLWEAIKENIVNRLDGFILAVQAAGKVIESAFKFDWDAAEEGAKDFGSALIQIGTGLDEGQQKALVETIKDFATEVKEGTVAAIDQAGALTALRNEVTLLEASQKKIQMTYQREAELQRQRRDDIRLTLDERIEANNKLGEILNDQIKVEEVTAKKRLELAIKERDQLGANTERLAAVAIAEGELADLRERIAGQESEQKTNQAALEKELFDIQQELRSAALSGREKELEDLDIYYEALAEKARLAGETDVEIEAARVNALADLKDKFRKEDLEKEEKAAAEKIAIEEKTSNVRIKAATEVGSALGAIGQLIAEQGQAGLVASKVLAVAQIAIDTATGISGAISAAAKSTNVYEMIAGIAAGIAAVISGVGQATAILNTANIPGPSASVPNVSNVTASAPSFSPVSTNTTELGNTEQAELAPIQAFVVETGITGSQENVNQIEGQATFGTDG